MTALNLTTSQKERLAEVSEKYERMVINDALAYGKDIYLASHTASASEWATISDESKRACMVLVDSLKENGCMTEHAISVFKELYDSAVEKTLKYYDGAELQMKFRIICNLIKSDMLKFADELNEIITCEE